MIRYLSVHSLCPWWVFSFSDFIRRAGSYHRKSNETMRDHIAQLQLSQIFTHMMVWRTDYKNVEWRWGKNKNLSMHTKYFFTHTNE